MIRDAEDLLEHALKLPAKERASLAHQLIESLDEGDDEDPGEVDKAWAVELERRLREVREGRVQTIPWDEAMSRARAAVDGVRAKRRGS